MLAAPTLPLAPSPAQESPPDHPPTTSRRAAWKPDGDAHLIYQWVKMQGKPQSEVASMLGISQPTVSRVIQRYERWQAHARERDGGRLDRAERARAQRWLTMERNELILATCLRIAHELEGSVDVSRSTSRRPINKPSQETEIRTEHSRIDRTGTVSRFLRLAFRINMEQDRLAELDEPAAPEPLSEEEAQDEARLAAEDAAEIARARQLAADDADEDVDHDAEEDTVGSGSPDLAPVPTEGLPDPRETSASETCGPPAGMVGRPCQNRASENSACQNATDLGADEESAVSDPGESDLNNLNNLHTAEDAETGVSSIAACACRQDQSKADFDANLECQGWLEQPSCGTDGQAGHASSGTDVHLAAVEEDRGTSSRPSVPEKTHGQDAPCHEIPCH
jgi:transposase